MLTSKSNFYVFLFSIATVLTTMYMNTKVVENFEEATDSSTGATATDSSTGATATDSSTGAADSSSGATDSSAIYSVANNLIKKNFFDETFTDEFVSKFGANNLKYYVSTFDKTKIDMKNNRLLNHVNLSTNSNFLEVPVDISSKLQQNDGLMINFSKPLKTVTPNELSFNHNTFTIMWFAKFLPVMSSSDGTTKRVLFLNIPIHSGKEGTMVGIEFEFQPQFVNPTIRIHWGGKDGLSGTNDDLQNNVYQWSSTTNATDMNFNFFDNKYHLFTLLRDNTGLKLILDDQDVGLQPLIAISQSELPDSLKSLPEYTAPNFKIRLNANVQNPTPSSDTASENPPDIALNCLLNSFAIFNTSLTLSQVNSIYEYFQNTKYVLDERYLNIKLQIDEAQNMKKCPFNDKALCGTNNCSSIKDWSNNNELMNNEPCFKDVVAHCKENNVDMVCSFFNENNLLKAASIVNNNTTEDLEKIADKMSDDEDLVKQLRKIGLNNIHLDKSLRANGKYANEINDLIDKIYKQKQLNVKGIQDLYDADSEELTIQKLNSDEILKGNNSKNENENENENKNKVNSQKKKKDLSLLTAEDLNYVDFEMDMKKYDSEKSENENSENKNNSFIGKLFF